MHITLSLKACGWTLLAALMVGACVGCNCCEARQNNALGVQLFNEGYPSAAQTMFQEALYHDPENPDVYYNLASTLHRQGDADQAEFYYNQCLDRDPGHTACYHALAVLLVEQGRRDDALALLEGWAEDMPWAPQPSVELAWLHRYTGDLASAEQHLQHALELDPRHPQALAHLGEVREQNGRPDSALALYERSLTSGGYHPAVAARVANLRAGGTQPIAPESRFVRREDGPPLF